MLAPFYRVNVTKKEFPRSLLKLEHVQENKQQGGIRGISARRYRGELGSIAFGKLLNVLDLTVWVDSTNVRIEGLIPLDIPMEYVVIDYPKATVR